MNIQTIVQAADNYAAKAKPSFTNGDFDKYAIAEAFEHGAEWRINSVWHEVRKKPDKGKLLIVEDIDSAYELVYLTNSKPWEELSKKNHYMHWAYVADLLPERKEAQP